MGGVAKDTTISALNVASGGDGNTVTIVANGKTVVSGSGDVTVTVTGVTESVALTGFRANF